MKIERIRLKKEDTGYIIFNGYLVDSVKTHPCPTVTNYSGNIGKWEEFYLYRTEEGEYIGQKINKTQWRGENDTYEALVCESKEEVRKFFGNGKLALSMNINK